MKKFTLILISILICLPIMADTNDVKVILTSGYSSQAFKQKAEKNISTLLTEMKNAVEENRDLNFNKINVSDSGKKNIESRWNKVRFYPVEKNISSNLIKSSDYYELRNISVQIENRTEEIAINIDKDATITGVFFILSLYQYNNIMSENNVADETRAKIILNFVDMMKDAYMNKDIDFIEKIYSDKALIIVGKTVQETNMNNFQLHDASKEAFCAPAADGTEYIKLTKKEYLNRLTNIFMKNEKIELEFSDIKIASHRKADLKNFYGVHLLQSWKSDNYKDLGYLFLAIEFREKDHPVIWVRAWQDAQEAANSRKIGFGDIIIKPDSN